MLNLDIECSQVLNLNMEFLKYQVLIFKLSERNSLSKRNGWLVGVYGISTLVGKSMSNSVYIYMNIKNI